MTLRFSRSVVSFSECFLFFSFSCSFLVSDIFLMPVDSFVSCNVQVCRALAPRVKHLTGEALGLWRWPQLGRITCRPSLWVLFFCSSIAWLWISRLLSSVGGDLLSRFMWKEWHCLRTRAELVLRMFTKRSIYCQNCPCLFNFHILATIFSKRLKYPLPATFTLEGNGPDTF